MAMPAAVSSVGRHSQACDVRYEASNFTSGGVQSRETKNRRLGTIGTSFQDFKLREKQISLTFSYFLINNAVLYHFLAN